VPLQFPEIVAKLVKAVRLGGKLKGGQDGLVDLFGGPTTHRVAAVQEHLQQADDAGVMDFDAGIADRTDGNRQGQALQQREVHMDIEALSLEAGETVRDGLEPLAHRIEMIQPFLQPEIVQIIGTEFVAQVSGELFVLFEEGVFPVGAEDMMTVFDLVDYGRQFPAQLLV